MKWGHSLARAPPLHFVSPGEAGVGAELKADLDLGEHPNAEFASIHDANNFSNRAQPSYSTYALVPRRYV